MSPIADARVIAVVQARMSSRRLPGKVLADIEGRTALEMIVRRLRRARELDEVVIATSVEPGDDAIERAVSELECGLHRGPLDDVLARVLEAAAGRRADGIVRVTADCPLVDPAIVDALVSRWRRSDAQYVSNVIDPLSFPKGLNAEVIGRPALESAGAQAGDPGDREHVTTYIRCRPQQFAGLGLWLDPPLPDAVLTLDTAEDLARLRALVERIGHDPDLETLLGALGAPTAPEFVDRAPAALSGG